MAPAIEPVAKSGPRSPEEERAALHVPEGFVVQLVASEPEIQKPLSINFDERGRLWVSGTVEYPFAAPPTRAGRDTVSILEDIDLQTGKAGKITRFADDLNIPICALPQGQGALVYSIPNIYRLVDSSGSGKADPQPKTILGVIGHDDTHGMTGSFIENFDGWIYACHGFANTSVLRAADGSEITMQSGHTYRFRPDGSHVEMFTRGQVNPFGMTVNAWGDIFASDCETKPIALLMRGACYQSFGKPDDGLGFAPDMVDHMYGSTAIAGLAVYAADSFPPEYRDRMFVGNVVTARINNCKVEPRGAGYHGDDQPDFLVSDDPWFRPVNIKLGPDGALYVADFYNRIIGHYEVDLNHPGRDKQRGRIWRIAYTGNVNPIRTARPFNLAEAPLAGVIAALGDTNLTVRLLAINHLVDHIGAKAAESVKQSLGAKVNAWHRAGALWVLHRLGALDEATLHAGIGDAEPLVRVHAMRVLAETAKWSAAQQGWALAALVDSDARVVRAATDALGRHPGIEGLRALLDLRSRLTGAAQSDAFLVHAVRMAIRDQLLRDDVAAQVPLAGWSEGDARVLAECAAAAPTAEAGTLLLRHLEKFSEPQDAMGKYLRHAARYVADAQQERLTAVAIKSCGDDIGLQLALFQSLREGIAQRGGTLAATTRAWGISLASEALALAPADVMAGWTTTPLEGKAESQSPWVVQARASADGNGSAPFWCSLPLGETLTGVLRSPTFTIPAKLSFFAAGHNGQPPARHPIKNVIRLKLADTNEVIAEAPPPRNDLAQPVKWDLADHAGKRGYIEATDGDRGTAYAWLAFGRFNPPVVTIPPPQVGQKEQLKAAIEIVSALRANDLSGAVERILTSRRGDAETRAAAASAIASLDLPRHLPALTAALEDESSPPALREAIAAALAPADAPAAITARLNAMRTAPQRLQLALAKSLAGTAAGGEALLIAVADGKASARLLLDGAVKERLHLSQASSADLDARLGRLTAGLPSVDTNVQKLIDARAASFDPTKASPLHGSHVFQKSCIVCHSIETKGARIGPQLDGIGKRGVARLCEDILDPSRNVDAAFRYNTFFLSGGDILDGIVRREEGATITLVDATGKETTIQKGQIQRRVESKLSLMPSNFGETLTSQEFYDLLSYLLAK
jgi:putative heme-binding domain-containing protein